MDKKQISLILGIVCMVLVFMICIQIKTIKDSTKTVSQSSFTEDNLRDEILRIKENYDETAKNVDSIEKSLEAERTKATQNDETSSKIETEIKKANDLLGLTELEGKGLIVTLDDNKNASIETIGLEPIENYLVHDGDLLEVINELKNAGAEAISVNDQRIVSSTGIICDGNVVRINEQKVGAPYVIHAIGNPEKLYGALTRPEGYIKKLSRYGVITDVKKTNSIKVPKYKGTFNVEYMKVAE